MRTIKKVFDEGEVTSLASGEWVKHKWKTCDEESRYS
jgi:hypothetical protein